MPMMSPASPRPIEKNLVLVGAGNAHLVFVKRFSMRPLPGIAVSLVNPFSAIPYSAMVPAYIAGDYSWDEVHIDLVRFCAAAGVRFLRGEVRRIDPAVRQVTLDGRPPLPYDALSLGLGSIPDCPCAPESAPTALIMRPMATFLQRLAELEKQVAGAFHLVVVGGGASGCELALALHQRLHHRPGFRLTLLQGSHRLLPEFPAATVRAFQRAFDDRGIAARVNARVVGSSGGELRLDGGEDLACDAVLWATNASPPTVLHDSGLALDNDGFLRVQDTLQSISDPAIFGTGDCVHFDAYPDLAKNGVHAVREGRVLFGNIDAFFRDQPLKRFRPQRFTLALLNTADGRAVLNYGPVALQARGLRRLKDRIDRAWMEKFVPPPPPITEEAEPLMRCGGCGSKIAGDVLAAALKRLPVTDDPRVLLGTRAGEDAAVFRLPEGKKLEVQTVDYFKAFVDDPFLFGRIAALHAVSDLYAMNARPFAALAVAALPHARGRVQEAQLHELLAGAVRTFSELGVVLAGGHTTEGSELALGFSVTGYADEDRLFRKGLLHPKDRLILTKPVGSGALLAAWMRGQCKARWFDPLIDGLLRDNARAAAIFAEAGVTACTDITGFGLTGHLLEMLDASRVSARLHCSKVPVFDGFADMVGQGIVSSLQRDNAKQACRVDGNLPLPEWLFDPQTSGGLLAGVQPDRAARVLEQLQVHYPAAAIVGEVLATADGENCRVVLD